MGHEDLDAKYLDPAVNPFLPGSDAKPFEKKPDPPDRYVDPAHNPMIDAGVLQSVSPDAGILGARIAAAFPDAAEIEIGTEKVVRMADGSFTIGSKPLSQVSPEILLRISWALDEKK
jgi:hypothetical protein